MGAFAESEAMMFEAGYHKINQENDVLDGFDWWAVLGSNQ